ncbi:MAG: hypothetical protein ACTSW4_06230 [Candidatus Ranarchaeia archaeon]
MTDQKTKILFVLKRLGGRIPGRIAFQKTIYLLQALGMDFGIKYRWYYFGPFAIELAQILDQLHYEGLIHDEISHIAVEEGFLDAAYIKQYKLSPKELAIIDKIKPFFRKMHASRWLELLASIHFIRSNSVDLVSRQDIFKALNEEKPNKFTEDEFNEAWFILNKLGL